MWDISLPFSFYKNVFFLNNIQLEVKVEDS